MKATDQLIEDLLDAAFRELQHDTGPQDTEHTPEALAPAAEPTPASEDEGYPPPVDPRIILERIRANEAAL